jgi:peroxiredoxin
VVAIGIGLLVLVARSAGGLSRAAEHPALVTGGPPTAGQLAPDFTATAFDGSTVTLSALRGRVVLVNFFASWCTVCAHELPAIQDEYAAHRDQGFAVVAVNTLENGDGRSFYRSFGLSFPAVSDPGQPGRIGAAYKVTTGLPASVFIGKDGRIDLIIPGEITRATIESELKKLL